jgi:hypothetical protein
MNIHAKILNKILEKNEPNSILKGLNNITQWDFIP